MTAVAERVGVHVNTARFHLDTLVQAGRAERDTLPQMRPGRRPVVYRATADDSEWPRNFRLLAEILAGVVATELPNPVPVATETGRRWGRYLTPVPPPNERIDAAEARRRVVATLDEIGFVPEDLPAGDEIRLHHCPFREVAVQHTDVVCAIHRGLMQGALEQMDAPVDTVSLEPFVQPHLCIATLRASAPATDDRGAR